MAHYGPTRVGSRLLYDVQDLEGGPLVPARVDGQGGTRLALGSGPGPEHLALVGVQRPGAPELADDPRLDAGVTNAVGDVGDYLAGDLVLGPVVHIIGMQLL